MVAALAPLADSRAALALIGLAGLLFTAAFDAVGAGAWATPVEALAWGTLGLVFARGFEGAPIAVGVALLVGGLDLAGLAGTASASASAGAGDPLTLEVAGAQVAALAVVVLAALCAWAQRLALAVRRTQVVLAVALGAGVALDAPVVAVLAACFLVVNGRGLARRLG